ncbi:hypothetical protein RI844_00890 [Thalassotalea fonticola]|uniref:DUF2868 domain-containing protein n=1 Tax=Thalassotalea fonticola TaxID=3065649 RepID=A0ABZ0GPT4_9GAMM|nr:hypothetical protein RI844_00890 [Colwelliaceae bacterium S1-1]
MSEDNSTSKWDIETPEWQWLTTQISREHSHINQRMTWYVTSQAFLFTGFAISTGVNGNKVVADILWLLIPIGSIILSIMVWFSLSSTRESIKLLSDERFKRSNQAFKNFWNSDKRKKLILLGDAPSKYTPILFVIIWTTLLLNYVSIYQ